MEPDQPTIDPNSPDPETDIEPALLEEKFGEILMMIVGTDLIFDMLVDNE